MLYTNQKLHSLLTPSHTTLPAITRTGSNHIFPTSQLPSTKIRSGMPNAEHRNRNQHWHSFEDVEYPFVREGVAEYAQGELDQTVDASNLCFTDSVSQPGSSAKSPHPTPTTKLENEKEGKENSPQSSSKRYKPPTAPSATHRPHVDLPPPS